MNRALKYFGREDTGLVGGNRVCCFGLRVCEVYATSLLELGIERVCWKVGGGTEEEVWRSKTRE